jgi:hypothetical protein
MLHVNGKCTCDREIGSFKRGWRSCNKKAHFEVVQQMCGSPGVSILHFCDEDHMNANLKENVPILRVLSHKRMVE